MKRLSAILLCMALCLAFLPALASCDATTPDAATTDAVTTAPAEDVTEAPTEDATEAPTEDETEKQPGNSYDDMVIAIGTAEELMAFNKAVNEDYEFFDEKTILITADIDMTGYSWIPLDGECLFDVTFDGQNHTISNLQFADYAPEQGTSAEDMGSGFVGVARGNITFKNLTFTNSKVVAYERAVANFVGLINANMGQGHVSFENCKTIGFTAEGWTDYNNQDREKEGHPISFRLAGFVGHIMSGGASFKNCHVEDITLYGFHNLAGFVGYDATNGLDAFSFTDCSVKNADFYFSYCYSPSYTIDMEKKYVSVFYNGAEWYDNIDNCTNTGNTYEDILFYDITDDNAEYDPSNLRSWVEVIEPTE